MVKDIFELGTKNQNNLREFYICIKKLFFNIITKEPEKFLTFYG